MLIVTLPAYNEERALPLLLGRIKTEMEKSRIEYRVIVVNDGSTDATRHAVEKMRDEIPVDLLEHPTNRGIGEAVRTGLLGALELAQDHDIIVTMDSDNTHTPDLIAGMVRKISENSDVVIASRYRHGARIRGVPLLRRVLSRIGNTLFRLRFPTAGVRDFTSGYRAYRAGLLKHAFARYGNRFVDESGFSCTVDILLKLRKLNAKMIELPLILRYDYKYGISKMIVARTIADTLKLLIARKPQSASIFQLDRTRVSDYFARSEMVSEWWTPQLGPLAFHYDAEIRVLDDHLDCQPSWRILDVGTGRGRFGAYFAERGCRVLGIDLNPAMLEHAREAARERKVADRFEVRHGNAEDLGVIGNQRFDVVLCMQLFDHLPSLERALSEMKRALAAKGLFVFTYVPSESLYGVLGNGYRWLKKRLTPKELLISRTYTLGEVRALLKRHQLALEDYWGIGVLCPNAQNRLFSNHPLLRPLHTLARAEANWRPYHSTPWLAQHSAHVVGFARAVEETH